MSIKKANDNLRRMFPEKHKDITLSEIYDRILLSAANITSTQGNTKIDKNNAEGNYLSAALTLSPSDISGSEQCVSKTAQCAAMCLKYSGRMTFYSVTRAQVIKTLALELFPAAFNIKLYRELDRLQAKAKKQGKKLCVRLNVLSDRDWFSVADHFPDIQFYDYTKRPTAIRLYLRGELPKNYFLVASRHEFMGNDTVSRLTSDGVNVAIPFLVTKNDSLPKTWNGIRVIDGDLTDLRFLDPKGVIVGLKAKGKARKATRDGFIIVNHTGRNAS